MAMFTFSTQESLEEDDEDEYDDFPEALEASQEDPRSGDDDLTGAPVVEIEESQDPESKPAESPLPTSAAASTPTPAKAPSDPLSCHQVCSQISETNPRIQCVKFHSLYSTMYTLITSLHPSILA